MFRRLLPLATATALLALAPAASHAGTITRPTPSTYLYTGDSTPETLTISATSEFVFDPIGRSSGDAAASATRYTIRFAAAGIAESADECTDNGSEVVCETSTPPDRVTANGSGGADSLTYNDGTGIFCAGRAGCLSIKSTFNGGEGNDVLSGSNDEDILNGDGGDDTIDGEGEGDSINGGSGNDVRLSGDAGNDTVRGDTGNDLVRGGTDNDFLSGDDGNDTIEGGTGTDTISAGNDNDNVVGGIEDDGSLSGGDGTDRIRYDEPDRAGGVTVDLSTSSGVSDGGPGETEQAIDFEQVTGTAGDDTVTGDAEANTLDGAGGNDTLTGLSGGDTLNGAEGNDRLAGGEGDDTLDAATGDDTLDGGLGADALGGGDGNDVADYSARSEPLTITVAADALKDDGGDGDGAVNARDNVTAVETVLGGSNKDTLSSRLTTGITLRGNAGDDTLTGTPADDTLVGGPGADAIDGAAGTDSTSYGEADRTTGVTVTIGTGTGDDGGAEDQNFVGQRDSIGNVENVSGTDRNDTLVGDGANNLLDGGAGDDTLEGRGGTDTLRGGGGTDTASYADRGDGVTVVLDGQANDGGAQENDDVGGDIENATGGGGNDTLTGSDGPNTLNGGGGNDTLTGGGAIDGFAAGPGDDTLKALDGNGESVDCGDGTDTAEVDAADQLTGCENTAVAKPVVDADGDGSPEGQDCDDRDARRKPGNLEIPGDDVDEDCLGGPAPFPVIGSTFDLPGALRRGRTFFLHVRFLKVPAGARVTFTCTPPKKRRKACPFKRFSRTVTKDAKRVDVTKRLKKRGLPHGTVLRLEVTHPQLIGKVRTLTMRRRSRPKVSNRCLAPGATKTSRCP